MMAWNALESQTRLDHQPIYADMVRTRSWGLLHQPGSLTYAHHDAAGQHTWALNMCGCKFWLIFTLKDEYAHLSEEERNAKFLNIFDSRNVSPMHSDPSQQASTLHSHLKHTSIFTWSSLSQDVFCTSYFHYVFL